jgi:hypothetical protein
VEAFESFVAVALEQEGYVVSEAVKFPVARKTGKVAYVEIQRHGYEVDLVGARANRLVLATVKSFFGSQGVRWQDVKGEPGAKNRKSYALLNDPALRDQIIEAAAERYGYKVKQVELHLYVGHFAAPKLKLHEPVIREWAAEELAGGGPIKVIGLSEIADSVIEAATVKQYRDNAVVVTIKALDDAGRIAGREGATVLHS